MANSQVITENHYQLWLNLTTHKLELHAHNCTHGLKKQWRQFQQFGGPILLIDQADLDSVSARALKLGEKYAPIPQKCSGPFYKGAA